MLKRRPQTRASLQTAEAKHRDPQRLHHVQASNRPRLPRLNANEKNATKRRGGFSPQRHWRPPGAAHRFPVAVSGWIQAKRGNAKLERM